MQSVLIFMVVQPQSDFSYIILGSLNIRPTDLLAMKQKGVVMEVRVSRCLDGLVFQHNGLSCG